MPNRRIAWVGALVLLGSACLVERDTDPRGVPIVIEADGNGTVTIPELNNFKCSGVCTLRVDRGLVFNLEATAFGFTRFDAWEDDAADCGLSTSCTHTIEAPVSLKAKFIDPGDVLEITVLEGAQPPLPFAQIELLGTDVHVVGQYQDTLDYGGATLTGVPGADNLYRAIIAADGTVSLTQLASADLLFARADLLPTGEILAAGWFEGNADFGGGPVTGGNPSSFFIAKYDAAGGHVWSSVFADASVIAQDRIGVHARSDGGLVLHAIFNPGTSVDFGGGTPIVGGAFGGILAVAFDTNGAHLWSHGFSENLGDATSTVIVSALAPNDDFIIGGEFSGDLVLDTVTLNSLSGPWFMASLAAADGTYVWSHQYAGSNVGFRQLVVSPTTGHIFLTAFLAGSINMGNGLVMNDGGFYQPLVARFNSTGVLQWQQKVGTGELGFGGFHDLLLTSNDELLATGVLGGTLEFGGTPYSASGFSDIVTARLSIVHGGLNYVRTYGGPNADSGYHCRLLDNGDCLLFGGFLSDTVIDGNALSGDPIFVTPFRARLSHVDPNL